MPTSLQSKKYSRGARTRSGCPPVAELVQRQVELSLAFVKSSPAPIAWQWTNHEKRPPSRPLFGGKISPTPRGNSESTPP